MTEQWRSIPGYEGFYEVSDAGSVRSVPREYDLRNGTARRSAGKLLRQFKTPPSRKCPGGYMRVTLCRCAHRDLFGVHQLVMLAFCGPRPVGMEVCHNDGDRANNQLTNLRYDTPKANWDDKRKHGTAPQGEKHARAKLSEQDVRDLRSGKYTTRQMADMRGVKVHSAYSAKSGKNWRCIA